MPTALAVAAHPDDIEFSMAGTLLLLKQAGWGIHYLNLSSGNCGSSVLNSGETARVRRAEARAAAKTLGAKWHAPFLRDLEILYTVPNLRRLASVIRGVNPEIVLTHPPVDYMEDHMETCRLTVTAAFAKNMPNFLTSPRRSAVAGNVSIYHALPHGLSTPLMEPVTPDFVVETTTVHRIKRDALAAHKSQKEWLDTTQGMDSYLDTMDLYSRRVGAMVPNVEYGEGWRRHLHLGFSETDSDPLAMVLKSNIHRPT
jgi:LmbE family N-acetylglucosaminyl deacetylase